MKPMDYPRRIQLSRVKGWRMPPDTLKVDRSTRWGYPFRTRDRSVAELTKVVAKFEEWITTSQEGHQMAEAARQILRGKNLACWCPEGGPCHADVLLRAANTE